MRQEFTRVIIALLGYALVALWASGAQAKFKVLHNFAGGFDGSNPQADLFIDRAGVVYGTTLSGGIGGNNGTLFEIVPGRKEKVVHSFTGGAGDGAAPHGGVIADSTGNLYGTTTGGGINGLGVVYKIAPDGSQTLVHTFQGICCGIDGSFPIGNLVMDKQGNLFGATQAGGSSGDLGSVFEIKGDGTESIVHGFVGNADGWDPQDGVAIDKNGSLYGTTRLGGSDSNCGIVYKITSAGSETVLHAFVSGSGDGCSPYGGLVVDSSGNLYGTTVNGGSSQDGAVYVVTPVNIETVVYNFCQKAGCTDGRVSYAKLTRDTKGNLYGVTAFGGANDLGIVFELKPTGAFKVIHTFNGADGANPVGGLVFDANGNLYGTTSAGGTNNFGVVFEMTAKTRTPE